MLQLTVNMFFSHVVKHLLRRSKVATPRPESGAAARDTTGNQAGLVPAAFLASSQITSRLQRPQRSRHLTMTIWQQLNSDIMSACMQLSIVVTVRAQYHPIGPIVWQCARELLITYQRESVDSNVGMVLKPSLVTSQNSYTQLTYVNLLPVCLY